MGCEARNPNAKLVVGLIAIFVGSVFLLDHQGIIHFHSLWRFWPMVFIAIGIGQMFDSKSHNRLVSAGTMFVIGAAFLAINFGVFGWGQVWPAALILVGVLLLFENFRSREPRELPSGPLNSYAVFSSIEKNINARDFSGGLAHAVFGSVEVDLRSADIQGDKAFIEVNAVFGSIEMKVPDTWKVEVEAGAVFGSCENRTRVVSLPTTPPKTLVVRGDIVFGSVEIRN